MGSNYYPVNRQAVLCQQQNHCDDDQQQTKVTYISAGAHTSTPKHFIHSYLSVCDIGGAHVRAGDMIGQS